ncbi:MAG: hypothetical protein KHX49_13585, partial [Lachnospiraceae bacterium]|nr:hypothetical protein [Lachnospiraceae bacterium]
LGELFDFDICTFQGSVESIWLDSFFHRLLDTTFKILVLSHFSYILAEILQVFFPFVLNLFGGFSPFGSRLFMIFGFMQSKDFPGLFSVNT